MRIISDEQVARLRIIGHNIALESLSGESKYILDSLPELDTAEIGEILYKTQERVNILCSRAKKYERMVNDSPMGGSASKQNHAIKKYIIRLRTMLCGEEEK